MSGNKVVKKTKKKVTAKPSKITIKYYKGMHKSDEFIIRVLERLIVRVLNTLENRRP